MLAKLSPYFYNPSKTWIQSFLFWSAIKRLYTPWFVCSEPKKSQSVKENETLGVNKFITFVLPESVATSSNLPSVMRCSFEVNKAKIYTIRRKQLKALCCASVMLLGRPNSYGRWSKPWRSHGSSVWRSMRLHYVPRDFESTKLILVRRCAVFFYVQESNMNMFPEPKLYEDDMLDLALNAVDT